MDTAEKQCFFQLATYSTEGFENMHTENLVSDHFESLVSIPAYDKHCKDIKDIQSSHFMLDILPVIQELYPNQIHELNVLDVGARTAAGTGLLAYLHHQKGCAKIRMAVDALDLDSRFKDRALKKYPEINDYIIRNIYDVDMPSYDLVICSHTIEHVPNIEKFMLRATEIARDYVIFACPYNEDLSKRYSAAPGNHINSITGIFLEQFKPVKKMVYDGQCFTGDLIVFVLKGTAGSLDAEAGDFRKLAKQGQVSEALKSIETTLLHRTQFSTLWVAYANLLLRDGRETEAIEACIKAVSLHPSDPALRYRLAQLLYAAGGVDEAMKQADIAWDMRKVPDYRVFMAEILAKKGDFDTAKLYLGQALGHKKTHPRALALQKTLEDSAAIPAKNVLEGN